MNENSNTKKELKEEEVLPLEALDEITTLFKDSNIQHLEALADEIAHKNKLCYDDLYVYTKSNIVIRCVLDEVTKREDLFTQLIEQLQDSFATLVKKFVAFTKKEISHQTHREVIALQELRNSYGNDYWSWAIDAFSDSTEYVGSDLGGYDEAEIQTATIQIIYNYW